MTVSMLREFGYTVLEAGNASEALPLGEHYKDRIDLLVTDVIMPRMNGVELAKRVRRARPGLPVLFISGYSKDLADEKEIVIDPNTPEWIQMWEDYKRKLGIQKIGMTPKDTR